MSTQNKIVFSRIMIGLVVAILFVFSFNRGLFFKNKSKLLKYSYILYASFWLVCILIVTVTNDLLDMLLPIRIGLSILTFNYVVVCITCLRKSCDKLTIVYSNIFANKPNLKVNFFRNGFLLLLFFISEVYTTYNFAVWVNVNVDQKIQILKLGTVFLSVCFSITHLDVMWSFLVFTAIRNQIEALYKRIKLDVTKNGKLKTASELHDVNSILSETFDHYKKMVNAQKVMVNVISPAYIVTISCTMTLAIVDTFFTIYFFKKFSGTVTLSFIFNYINDYLKGLVLALLLCIEGDIIRKIDKKLTVLLTVMLLECKDGDPLKATLERFLRYIERNQDKLTMLRIVSLTQELPYTCVFAIINFSILAIQFFQVYTFN